MSQQIIGSVNILSKCRIWPCFIVNKNTSYMFLKINLNLQLRNNILQIKNQHRPTFIIYLFFYVVIVFKHTHILISNLEQ